MRNTTARFVRGKFRCEWPPDVMPITFNVVCRLYNAKALGRI
jgi:hypothetical protein